MKNIPTSVASPAAQQALDLQLIKAVTNPLGKAQYENELTQAVDRLLDQRADVNARSSDDGTALMIAAKNGHKEIVTKLLDRGADVNAATLDGGTALILAAQNGHTEIADRLRDFLNGFQTINPLFDRESLVEASRKGRAETSASPNPSAAAKTAAKIDNSGKDRKK